MGNTCSNTKDATVENVKKAYDNTGEYARAQKNGVGDARVDARAQKNGVGDPTLTATKAEIKALSMTVSALIDAYKPQIAKSSDLLHLPSLAMWTTELPFLGGEDAILPIHSLAAHVEEISAATLRARATVIKRYVDDLTECKVSLRTGVDALNAYLDAAISLKDKTARLQQLKALAAGVAVPAAPAPPAKSEEEGDAKEGDGEEDGKEEPNEAERERSPAPLPQCLPPKTQAKLTKLEAEVEQATAKVEATKAAAFVVREETLPAIKAEKLKEAHERLKAGLLEEAARVAGLLGEPDIEARFAAYKPTSATTCLADGVAKIQRVEIKLDFFGKDASEKAALVAGAEKRLKASDLYLDLAQKQVAAYLKDGLNASAKDVIAIDALAAALPEEEGTRAAIAAARVAAASDAGVSNAKTAGKHFVSELEVYRGHIAARLAQAKAYHELGKQHTRLVSVLRKKEAAGTQGEATELQELRNEVENLATQLAETYEKFEADLAVMGDGELSNSRLVAQRIVVPFALFVTALVDVWKAQHEPHDDIELSTGVDPRSIEWLYPPVPELSDPSPEGPEAAAQGIEH